MKSLITEFKKKKQKRGIFKEILRENVSIIKEINNRGGKKNKPNKNLFKILRNIFLLCFGIFLLISFFEYDSHSLPLTSKTNYLRFPDNSQGSNLSKKELGGTDFEAGMYKTFITKLGIPLRKIFGLKVKTIVIDPGHGGRDPGATGKLGTREKDITLDIAKRLENKLLKYDKYKILLTRLHDKTLNLEERIEFANTHKADLYISIHVNYIPSRPDGVIETYYFGPHKNKKDLLLAEQENRGTEYTLSDFKKILGKIENTLKTQESKSLALSIQRSLYKNIKKNNKNIKNFGIKTAPFVVLLGVNAPSVLAEVTCLSSSEEELKLNKAEYREAIALYLEQGIENYLNKNKKKEVHNAGKRNIKKKR